MKKLCIFLIIILLSSCARFSISRNIRNFVGSEIQFPSELKLIEGLDPYYIIHDEPYGSLIIWYDTKECSPCRLSNIADLKKLFNLCRDSLTGIDVRVVFTPSFEKRDFFMDFVHDSEREFPVFVDENDVFGKANKTIPKEPKYHTFLVDRNNKVLLTGNPLLGPAIWNLYRNTMFSLSENKGLLDL